MQSLFLKSLVLTGVIGVSCFVVWLANENLQKKTAETDPNSFSDLHTPDDSDDVEEHLPEADSLNLAGYEPQFGQPQSAPSQNEQEELVPTLAKPQEPTPASANQDLQPTIAANAPGFPQNYENSGSAPAMAPPLNTEPAPSPTSETVRNSAGLSGTPNLTRMANNDDQPSAPVMPLSFYPAGGSEIPHVAMNFDQKEEDTTQPVASAPSQNEDSNAPILPLIAASSENFPGSATLPKHPELPNQTEETEQPTPNVTPAPEQPSIAFGPSTRQESLASVMPENTQPAPILAADNATTEAVEPAGLTRLPASSGGPLLLPPSALPTLGMNPPEEPSALPNRSGIVTADVQEVDGQSIKHTSGENENPFARFKTPPVSPNSGNAPVALASEDIVVPAEPNPFAKFRTPPVATSEVTPVAPESLGFNPPPVQPEIPEVAENPFSRAPSVSEVTPSRSLEQPPAQPVPEELLPPVDTPVMPSRDAFAVTAPEPAPNNLEESAVLPTPTAPEVSGFPGMMEPTPLQPAETVSLPAMNTEAPASNEEPILPADLPPPTFSGLSSSPPDNPANNLPANNVDPFNTNRPEVPAATANLEPVMPTPAAPVNSVEAGAPSEIFSGELPTPKPAMTARNLDVPTDNTAPLFPSNDNLSSGEYGRNTPETFAGGNNASPLPTPAPNRAAASDVQIIPAESYARENLQPADSGRSTIRQAADAVVTTESSLTGNGIVDPTIPSTPQSPELKIEKIAPAQASIGEPLIYAIRIRNVGGSTARSVVVEDRIPRGTRLEGTIPQAVLTNDKLSWELGKIGPGEERTIQLKVIPTQAGDIGSVATVSFEAAVAATIRVTAPELSVDIEGPAETLLGKNVPYKFTVKNTGQGAAKDVVLRAILPPSLKHPNGNDIEAELQDIPPGESRTVDLVVVADQVGVSTPKVLIWMGGKDIAQNRADLRILESRIRITRDGPKRRFVGRTAQYVTKVTNDSSSPLSNVSVVEQLPVSVDIANNMNGWDPKRRVIQRMIPVLQPGETQEFVTQIIPNQAGDVAGKLIVQDLSGNRAELETPLSVKGFAELEADVRSENKVVAIGDQVSFRLNLKNDGTAAATNVQAAFEIPPGLAFATASGPSTYRLVKNRVEFDPVSEIPTNGAKTYDIVLTAAEVCNTKVKVAITAADYEVPVNLDEPVRVFSDTP